MPEITCKECGKVCKSLQGWKQHQTYAHGGYDESDISRALGAEPEPDAGTKMNAFADTIPVEETIDTEAETAEEQLSDQPAPAPVGKRIKAPSGMFDDLMSSIPRKILESQNITLDREDEKTLDALGTFMSDLAGVEFAVPEAKYVVQSRSKALLWILGAIGLIYVKHKFSNIFALFKKSETPTE